ncbi:GFA family protein [Pontixanthobacter aestiaquae]|uniref:GFA family protein n=1 Tax=Pontixanthobacter aestiaquae TaxID=1509367 RepID=A0A844Z5Q4_9SPHN|nr:GFA family protein [Pontixanthobacter aestiaquae]MDN3646348.1 GFA family protein [Pontixanthobacter aestiaquae]MXO82662.1 GFA family protein [Pontixanthobacter aestiaquae]
MDAHDDAGVIDQAEGKCLCGAVTIVVAQMKPHLDICHCDMCRRWGGMAFMGISGKSFTLSGEEHVTSYPSSQWAERAFCNTCGSNLWYRFTPDDHYSFLAGLFDLPDNIGFLQQIFIDEKPGYYDFVQQCPMKTGSEIIAEAEAAGHIFPSD